MTEEYNIIEDIMHKLDEDGGQEAEEKTFEQEVEELEKDIAELRRHVMENTQSTEERVALDSILGMVDTLFHKEAVLRRDLRDPEIGRWVYSGDDSDKLLFSLKVLAIELGLCDMLRKLDKMSEVIDKPFEVSEHSLSIIINTILVRIALEQLHLSVHKAYKAECMGETDDGEEDDEE